MRILLLLVPIALAPLAEASPNKDKHGLGRWYFQAGGGVDFPTQTDSVEPDPGWALNGLFGYELLGGDKLDLALEVEGWYGESDLSSFSPVLGTPPQDLKSWAFTLNAVLDIWLADPIAWYLGAGAGYGKTEVLGEEEAGASFLGKTGLRYEFGGGFSWNLGYRYLRTPDVSFGAVGIEDFEGNHHVLETGVRWTL